MARVTMAERVAGRGIDATNSISESLLASSTHGIKVGSTIWLDHCAAEGQTRANNDFGRQYLSLVSGRQVGNEMNDKPMGTFHLLPPELQKTAIMASKEHAKSNRKNFDAALEKQFKKRRMEEEIMLR